MSDGPETWVGNIRRAAEKCGKCGSYGYCYAPDGYCPRRNAVYCLRCGNSVPDLETHTGECLRGDR